MFVGAEEGVVDEVRVIACDVGGGRDRIQHLEIRVRDEADRSAFLLRVSARRAQRGRRRGGGGAPEKPAAAEPRHGLLLLLRHGRLGRLEADLAVRAVAERLRDGAAAAAQRDARPTRARVDLRALYTY